MSHASDLKKNPDRGTEDAIKAVQDASKAGGSQSRIDKQLKDGSTLTIVSTAGAEADLIVTYEEDAATPPAPPTQIDTGQEPNGPATGLGDDGVLRDTGGNEIDPDPEPTDNAEATA